MVAVNMELVYQYGPWIAIIMVVICVLILVGSMIKNKMIFVFRHRTLRLRKDQKSKEVIGKAGFITKRNGIKYFRLKLGRMPWQKIDLIDHPNLNEMDGNNTVYYTQLGPEIFLQSKRELIPRVEYSDYVRDKYGELVQMHDEKNQPVWLRDTRGNLIYETVYESVEGKRTEVKNPIPIYIPLPEEYKLVEEIKPLSNMKKAYSVSIMANADRAIEGEQNWKTALVWVGGAVMIIVVTVLSFYLLGGGFSK